MRVTALVFCLAAMLAFTSSASADKVDWSDFIETRPAKQQPKAAPAPAKVARTQTARPQPKRAAQPAKAVAKKKALPKPRRR
jgi:hypothetical protein